MKRESGDFLSCVQQYKKTKLTRLLRLVSLFSYLSKKQPAFSSFSEYLSFYEKKDTRELILTLSLFNNYLKYKKFFFKYLF